MAIEAARRPSGYGCGLMSIFGLGREGGEGARGESADKDQRLDQDADNLNCHLDNKENPSRSLEANASEGTQQTAIIEQTPPSSPRPREEFSTRYDLTMADVAIMNAKLQSLKAECELNRIQIEIMHLTRSMVQDDDDDDDDVTGAGSTDRVDAVELRDDDDNETKAGSTDRDDAFELDDNGGTTTRLATGPQTGTIPPRSATMPSDREHAEPSPTSVVGEFQSACPVELDPSVTTGNQRDKYSMDKKPIIESEQSPPPEDSGGRDVEAGDSSTPSS